MQEVHLQLPEPLFDQAQRRAIEAGFATLDEYIVDVVSEDLTRATENLDHRFTPTVVAHLNQIQADIQAGAKTYSEAEMDEHFRERAHEWREAHTS